MSVVIIDYGSGNLHSAAKAFERASTESETNRSIKVSADPQEVRRATHIVLPGVGAFGDCKAGLAAIDGMIETLEETVHREARPFLGICVGMQLMAERGLEHGLRQGFGWVGGEVRAIEPDDRELKIPHMGWNTLEPDARHPLLEGIEVGDQGQHAYFVHSYHLAADDEADVVAHADYGGPVTAMVGRDNMVGTQFHPEKSQKLGLKLIANFLKWTP